jgi:hypothetical protein
VPDIDFETSGNALTDFFTFDIGISLNQFNIGQLLLSLGIVILEVSSTIRNSG